MEEGRGPKREEEEEDVGATDRGLGVGGPGPRGRLSQRDGRAHVRPAPAPRGPRRPARPPARARRRREVSDARDSASRGRGRGVAPRRGGGGAAGTSEAHLLELRSLKLLPPSGTWERRGGRVYVCGGGFRSKDEPHLPLLPLRFRRVCYLPPFHSRTPRLRWIDPLGPPRPRWPRSARVGVPPRRGEGAHDDPAKLRAGAKGPGERWRRVEH